MEKYLDILSRCVLFKDIDKKRITEILNLIPYNIKTYKKGNIIAMEGENCHSLGIILEGEVEVHKSFPSGKIVTIKHFNEGNVFGEALVFSGRHTYPATIVSAQASHIMYLKQDIIVKLMTLDDRIIKNFMGVLSNRILMLNDRLTNLSFDTLRKKIANIILLEYKVQNSLNIKLPYNRKKMAELLNIPRPSLSRELINMKEEGIINIDKNQVKILNLKGLEDSLL